MSTEDYENALNLINENEFLSDFVGKCPEQLVRKAEEKLNLSFPKSYKQFLLNFGAGNFGSEEVYGIVKEDFENSGIPDAIWYTIKQRKEVNLPSNLVVIYHTGGEEIFCLDTNKPGKHGEPAVISYAIGVDPKHQTYEIIANDFGEFLLQRVKLELGIS